MISVASSHVSFYISVWASSSWATKLPVVVCIVLSAVLGPYRGERGRLARTFHVVEVYQEGYQRAFVAVARVQFRAAPKATKSTSIGLPWLLQGSPAA